MEPSGHRLVLCLVLHTAAADNVHPLPVQAHRFLPDSNFVLVAVALGIVLVSEQLSRQDCSSEAVGVLNSVGT